jgi:Lrp/AsnC family leucine-responsive transcriptional regulator
MPFQLDDYDVSILRVLLEDGRKSFREISRETGITTPTVKARFDRLVNVGFIMSVSPILNFDLVEKKIDKDRQRGGKNIRSRIVGNEEEENKSMKPTNQLVQMKDRKSRIKKGMKIKIDCEFCKGPITGDPHVFRCCTYTDRLHFRLATWVTLCCLFLYVWWM